MYRMGARRYPCGYVHAHPSGVEDFSPEQWQAYRFAFGAEASGSRKSYNTQQQTLNYPIQEYFIYKCV